MNNFNFYTPTRVIFGKDGQHQVGKIIREYGFSKVLLHYGSGSVKKSGLYDQVVASLNGAGVAFAELGGVEPNPKMSLVRKGIELARSEKVEMVLAVGGGSVLDSSKAIAVGAMNDVDPVLFFEKKETPKAALPVGTILTLSASGSEMSQSCVITNDANGKKRGYNSVFHRPLFSILNPELTYTVSPYQTACGITDIMMHTLERYLSQPGDVELTDRIAEALLKSVIHAGKAAMANPCDYEARATLMWAGSLSHNDLTGCGRGSFMSCHQIEHEMSGKFDRVAHGAGLAVVFPAWAKYVYKYDTARFAQYAVRVWNCEMDYAHPENTALAGIEATEAFFASIGMPTRLSQLDIHEDSFEEMAWKCTNEGTRTLPTYIDLDKKEIIDILKLAE